MAAAASCDLDGVVAEPLHGGIEMLFARRGVGEIANPAHHAARGISGHGRVIRREQREERRRVLRHARLHRHPDDVRVVGVGGDAGAGEEFF